MPNIIAEYYTDELVDWDRTISYYDSEMVELGKKLAEIIQRNNIPDIGAKVEVQQHKLDVASNRFHKLYSQIQKQKMALVTDSTFIDDSLINTETEKKQKVLRSDMQLAEKEYIDAKYECRHFLSGIMKK